MSAPKVCVIGWPIGHSRSPLIHGYWLRHHAIDGTYEKVAVAPDALATFLSGMRANGFVGANVTIPHKAAAAKACDVLSPTATRLGVVNTLWFEGDRLHGDTTDGVGFLAALDEEARGWDDGGGLAIVLGAGGAARATVDALLAREMRVTIASRTAARSEALALERGCCWTEMAGVTDRFPCARLLVNTTPAGMVGHDALDLDLSGLPNRAAVDDIVYVPRLTPLLRDAEARGLRTVGGLGMLLHQAAPGFERWFGVKPEVTSALRALVGADIAGTNP